MKAYLLLACLLLLPLAGRAGDPPKQASSAKDSATGMSFDATTLRMLIGAKDIQASLQDAERKRVLRILANPRTHRPDWIPEYSTPPRWDVLDETRDLRLELFRFGLGTEDQPPDFIGSPYPGFRLHTWEQTPEIILDREGARRDLLIRK